jgi:hypothetical protein
MITIERARCLYALLTEAPIDYDFVVTSTMMSVRLLDKVFALPYEALITQIAVLQGGHDGAEGGSARERGYGHMLPQRELGSLAGGGARAESTATVESSTSWQDTC